MEAEEQDLLEAARYTSDSTDPPRNLHQILATVVANSQTLAADSLTGTVL